MRLAIQFSERLYAAVLYLYPYEFRTELCEEMQAVFAATVSEAAEHSTLRMITL